jgi:hypothetical protein
MKEIDFYYCSRQPVRLYKIIKFLFFLLIFNPNEFTKKNTFDCENLTDIGNQLLSVPS